MAQPKKDEKPQKQRFIEKARQLEADESGKLFECVFKKIVPPKRQKKTTRA